MESETKRRKLRKGTHSCWECKRMKIRCAFQVPTDTVCISCRRRGKICVNQELPEEIFDIQSKTTSKEPVVRVEVAQPHSVEAIHKKVDVQEPPPSLLTPHSNTESRLIPSQETPVSEESTVGDKRPTLDSGIVTWSRSLGIPESISSQAHTLGWSPLFNASKYAEISRALFAALPSRGDADILCKTAQDVTLYFYQVNTRPHCKRDYAVAEIGGIVSGPPTPEMHPVLLARKLLIFASILQQLGVDNIKGMIEEPRKIMTRLVETSIRLVTTNEELVGTMEGIECIVLEGVFQKNCGNLRRAWLAFRRAMMVAQLMGINRPDGPPSQSIDPDDKMRINPQFMWFRIVYMDRFLSLMLGLPQGTTDTSMVSGAAFAGDTAMGKLERSHAIIAARILERKERDPHLQDFNTTNEIDTELLKIARGLPDSFWLPPNFSSAEKDIKKYEFLETLRLVNQLVHYYLIAQLHLPYLLRSGSNDTYKYSRMACVNASREILTRSITYSSFNKLGYCCRRVDFFALMASMTLVLALLDCHRHPKTDNILSHQRLGDRALMGQVLQNMERVEAGNDEVEKGKKNTNLLRCLLKLEKEADEGQDYVAKRVESLDGEKDDEDTLRISIPYFGIVKISKEGVFSKEVLSMSTTQAGNGLSSTTQAGSGHVSDIHLPLGTSSSQTHGLDGTCIPSETEQSQAHLEFPLFQRDIETNYLPSTTNGTSSQQQYLYPNLTAGIEDWVFQGVDSAFFDSVMMESHIRNGSGGEGGEVDWHPGWQGEHSEEI